MCNHNDDIHTYAVGWFPAKNGIDKSGQIRSGFSIFEVNVDETAVAPLGKTVQESPPLANCHIVGSVLDDADERGSSRMNGKKITEFLGRESSMLCHVGKLGACRKHAEKL